MTPPDFRRALAEEDERIGAEGMSAEAARRVRSRLQRRIAGETRASRTNLRFVFAGGFAFAAVAAVALFLFTRPVEVAGFEVVESAAPLQASANGRDVQVEKVRAVLADHNGGTFAVEPGGVVENAPEAVHVLRGTVEVSVKKRAPGAPPYRVAVSDAVISVLGTRFTIVQDAGGGQVTLHEGRIRLEHRDGAIEELTPGQSSRWPHVVVKETIVPPPPVEPTPAPMPEPVKPEPVKPEPVKLKVPPTPVKSEPTPVIPAPAPLVAPPTTPEEMRGDVLFPALEVLRSRGRFEQEARTIEAALGQGYSPETLEKASFELVQVLTDQLADHPRACEALARHLRRWPAGRYESELTQLGARAACPPVK